MKKGVVWTLLVLIILIVLTIILYPKESNIKVVYENNSQIIENDSQPIHLDNFTSSEFSDFNVYYVFGMEGSILDTLNNLYEKRTCQGNKNYTFILTDNEKTVINTSLHENDFFTLKNNFTTNCDAEGNCHAVSPWWAASLTVKLNGKIKTIKWNSDYTYYNDPEVIKFMKIQKAIEDIISKKEKAMNITQPTCMYA